MLPERVESLRQPEQNTGESSYAEQLLIVGSGPLSQNGLCVVKDWHQATSSMCITVLPGTCAASHRTTVDFHCRCDQHADDHHALRDPRQNPAAARAPPCRRSPTLALCCTCVSPTSATTSAWGRMRDVEVGESS